MAKPISSKPVQFLTLPDDPRVQTTPVPYWNPPKGLNLTSRLSRVAPEYAVDIKNLILDDGVLRSRKGTTLFSSLDRLLQRPVFTAPVFDIVWYQGEQFISPSGSIVTTHFNALHVQTLDQVDGIQVAAETSDFSITGWNEQVQDSFDLGYTSGFNPNDAIQFSFDIDQGMGTMSPRAFRARTYKVIDGVTQYSFWRYFFAGKVTIDLTVTDMGVVAGTQTFQVSSTDGKIHAQYWNGSAYINGVFTSPHTFAVVQQLDVLSVLRSAYRFAVRTVEPISFTDDQGESYSFDLYSNVHTSVDGTAPLFPPPAVPDNNQFPWVFPPNPDPS